MDYELSLRKAREARKQSRWEPSARAAQEALECLGAEPSDDWIVARLIFGSSVACGELAPLVEAAIERVSEALIALIEEDGDERVGSAHRTLGYLFELRLSGTRSTNLSFALHHFKNALKYYTREASPEDWGHLKVAIALDSRERLAAWAEEGYRVRDDGDYRFRRSEVEAGISSLRDALEVFSNTDYAAQHREINETIEAFFCLLDRLPREG